MSSSDFSEFLRKVFSQYSENAKDGAPYYVFHAATTAKQFQDAMEERGLEVVETLVWNKPSAGLGMNDYRRKHEPFFYARKKGQKPQFFGDRTNTSVWDFKKSDESILRMIKAARAAESEGKTTVWTMKRDPVGEYVHPTQKPVELIGYAIQNSSKAGDTVLDLFAGSGSTLIACEKHARECRTMELDPVFAETVVLRFA
jgi:DNA modification methylase